MFSKILTLLIAVSLAFASVTFAEESDPVLGKAGDYVIRKSDLDRLVTYYPPQKQKFLQENPQQKITLIKRMLEVMVISDIARKQDFTERLEVKEQLRFMTNDFISREYLTKVVMEDVNVTDDDIRHHYDINKEKFSLPEQVSARHILIRVSSDAPEAEKKAAKDKAEEILHKLKEGEDFAKLAEEFSDDPGSKTKGGDLGFFSKGKMVKAFEDAAFSMKPGEMSGIVETNFGYHIIKVEDYKEGRTRPIKEVKEQIREQLKNNFAKSKAEEFITSAAKEAGMEIYTDKIMGQAPEK